MSEQKGNKLLVLLVVITLILVIGLGIVLGYFIFFKDKTNSSTQTNIKVEEKIMDLKEFVVNLSDEDKTYIRITISLAYDKKNKKLDKELPNKVPAIRDVIIEILRKKKTADFNSNNIDNIKKELIKAINSNLTNGEIINIYIQDIIIQ
ncbi:MULTISPECIES: flagellar basal body-associated FliL family protein [Caloramator]|uniref:Flagellar protein FliL n=1 Tax=Caloramator proteoclasticus DSM 10124 TaxID=1121262 RepID=A0A1M4ST88_9CLOT|nr:MULTISPECIES: flagellar basal body-associated FliL family protein [Caloramator]SHE35385.1 flagellar FliL protein [Caloramator proteoclasticus DSM 10124]